MVFVDRTDALHYYLVLQRVEIQVQYSATVFPFIHNLFPAFAKWFNEPGLSIILVKSMGLPKQKERKL